MNCSIEESLKRVKKIAELASKHGVKHSGGIAMALGCSYEGKVSPTAVAKLVERLMEYGCSRIGIGDSIGVGNASSVNALFDELLRVVPAEKITVHFHDTYGQALTNVLVAIERGVRIAESSVAGLGGGPYAKGATGNLATENLVYMLHELGFNTGIDLDEMVETGMWICNKVGKPNVSATANAMWALKNDTRKNELPTTPFLR
uniref:hydroxymethylglutaryl-CoA lyase n=1 Tax=Acrobeloides nanus TaxID=290746 RepID=A0A914C0Q1_9BILA